MSLHSFISLGLEFCTHLEMHHNIEEQHIFPFLAKKMPAFKKGGRGNGLMIKQHKQIHQGLEKMEAYLKACKSGERELRMREGLGEIMESFGEVLWVHLEEEVEE